MNNKLIIGLLTIIMCLMLIGCGKENTLKNDSNNNLDLNQTSDNVDNNKSDNIIVDDEENGPINEETGVIEEVINCDGCVYAYFTDEGDKAKTLGSTISSSDYTKDITKLKTIGGKQRHNFFGLVLSSNTIARAYSCILKDSKVYCIEGSVNGAYHSNNIAILNKIFTSSQCKTISDGHTYTCIDGSYNGNTKTSGYTSMHYETSCTIYGANANTGKLICH